jgi:hypothetical protein
VISHSTQYGKMFMELGLAKTPTGEMLRLQSKDR